MIYDHKTDVQQGIDFIKVGAHGANHRDCSIHLCPTPTPNFLRTFLLAQKLGVRE